MSAAASRSHAPSVEAKAEPPDSTSSVRRSHHSEVLNATRKDESTPGSPAISLAARSKAASDNRDPSSPIPEIPPPHQSISSFAAPSVSPLDSVSQIGSRRSKSASRLSTTRSPPKTNGSHYSQGTNARSQASSSRLTKANLHAHNAAPQLILKRAHQSEGSFRSGTEETTRSSHRGRNGTGEEPSSSQSFAQQARSTVLSSRASTAKASQKDTEGNNKATPQSAASKTPTEVKPTTEISASKFENPATPTVGSKAATAIVFEFDATEPNGGSSRTEPHATKVSASHVGSRAGTAVPSHVGSKAQVAESSQSNSTSFDHADPHLEPEAATLVPSPSRLKASSEAMSKTEFESPQKAATYSLEGSKTGSGSPLAPKSAASREPSLRISGSSSDIRRKTGNTYIVEVERDDEQIVEKGYRVQRRHEYHVKD